MKNKILLSVIALSVGLTTSYGAGGNFDFVQLRSTNTYVQFDDESYTGSNVFLDIYQWQFGTNLNADASLDDFYLWDMKSWLDNGDATKAKTLIFNGGGNSFNSMVVDTSGDINLANGSVFIDRSSDYMGIGTTIPKQELHIKPGGDFIQIGGSNAGIRLEASKANSNWDLYADYTYDPMCIPPFCRRPTKRFKITDVVTSETPFTINSGAKTGTLVLGSNSNVGIGTVSPTTKIHAKEQLNSSEKVVTELVALEVSNTNATGFSDTGFKLVNSNENVSWTFRTLEEDSKAKGNTNSFAISKKNSGKKELILTGEDAEHGNMLILANGAYCDGVWHNTSSRSMKKDIKPLSTKAALETFSKLQPVTYVYKSNPTDQKVGFIAEDVPELVADPKHKSLSSMDMVAVLTKVVQEQDKVMNETKAELKIAQDKIAKLELMQKRLAKVESLLTNLALDTSNMKTEKVSLNK